MSLLGTGVYFTQASISNMTDETTPKRRRRTNAEILADMKAERDAPKVPQKRHRRTKAQIEADRRAEERRREALAEEAAKHIPKPAKVTFDKTFHFLSDGVTAFGKVWYRGEEVRIVEGSVEFDLAFDRLGNFIFSKTIEEQYAQWGEVRYAEGPWPYQGYDPNAALVDDAGNPIALTEDEKMTLQQVNKQRNLST